ncbi:MAG TPA: hypothetical protein VH988_32935 [Thermoanaerobaculia bacterium]|nr:hypothetical protein [Thermoanaerobaculia bacterium]
MTEPTSGAPPPEPPPGLTWGARFWLVVVILIGPTYLLWMTGVEGRRLWIVVGLVFLIAGFATLAHWLMGLTRR